MVSGGARTRSGPPADPSSGRSDRRGYTLTSLPAEGFRGRVPKFPLRKRTVWNVYYVGDGKDREQVREVDEAATEDVWAREVELWKWHWRTPQAAAWALPSEKWRLHTIALYVRTFVVCEGDEATAADKNSLHRFADQIGMTTPGLAAMGWKVATDEVRARGAERAAAAEPAEAEAPKRERRLRVAGDAQ